MKQFSNDEKIRSQVTYNAGGDDGQWSRKWGYHDWQENVERDGESEMKGLVGIIGNHGEEETVRGMPRGELVIGMGWDSYTNC
jgi:hypothetical protein